MAITPAKTVDLTNQIRANIEAAISQTTPNAPKAFNRVLATTIGMVATGMNKLALERTRATLALTATGVDLEALGSEKGVVREPAVQTQLTCRVGATVGSEAVVPIGTTWVSDSTGATYTTDATSAPEVDGTIEFTVTADEYGDGTILGTDDTLTIGSPIIAVEAVADVYTCDVDGQDEESDTDYRRRVLAAWRTVGGGGNAADYRRWAEACPGVARAYPYSGRPLIWTVTSDDISFDIADSSINSVSTDFTADGPLGTFSTGDVVTVSGSTSNDGQYTVQSVTTHKIRVAETMVTEAPGDDVTLVNLSMPGDRTVYIESETDVDGIPGVEMLAAARALINVGEDGIGRVPLGLPDSTLFVEPIRRTTFDLEILDLVVDASVLAALKAQMDESMDAFFSTREPYIAALDFELDRADQVTAFTVGTIVQDVFDAYGASATSVTILIDAVPVTNYTLGQGELAKLGTISWEVTP